MAWPPAQEHQRSQETKDQQIADLQCSTSEYKFPCGPTYTPGCNATVDNVASVSQLPWGRNPSCPLVAISKTASPTHPVPVLLQQLLPRAQRLAVALERAAERKGQLRRARGWWRSS